MATWYASRTRSAPEEIQALVRRVAEQIPRGSQVLEIACGPGNFAIELAKLGNYRISGIDSRHRMVQIARRNAAKAGVDVDFRQGNTAGVPYASRSFDFLLCRAAFKNFSQPVRALQEIYRVLKPGGRALIIDLRSDASQEFVREAVDAMGLGRVDRWITRLAFRFNLLRRAHTRAEFEEFLSQTKFGPIETKEDRIGLELWLQRRQMAKVLARDLIGVGGSSPS
jgi:ubiquinone/menaquinone biosynthesis C-methylase UbiE